MKAAAPGGSRKDRRRAGYCASLVLSITVAAEVLAIDLESGILRGVDGALQVVFPVALSHAHVLDVLRAVIGVFHEPFLADLLGLRNAGTFVEVNQAIVTAPNRRWIQIRMPRLALDHRGGFLDPSIVTA